MRAKEPVTWRMGRFQVTFILSEIIQTIGPKMLVGKNHSRPITKKSINEIFSTINLLLSNHHAFFDIIYIVSNLNSFSIALNVSPRYKTYIVCILKLFCNWLINYNDIVHLLNLRILCFPWSRISYQEILHLGNLLPQISYLMPGFPIIHHVSYLVSGEPPMCTIYLYPD